MNIPEDLRTREPRAGVRFRVNPSPHDVILFHNSEKLRDHYVHADYYAVAPDVYASFVAEPLKYQKALEACYPFRLYFCVESDNETYFLWPVRLPKDGEEMDPLWSAKHAVAERAMAEWIASPILEHLN
jgi:hypothetical protein